MPKVKALKNGFFGGMRRRPGDVFDVTDEKKLSSKWMEVIKDEPETEESEAKPKAKKRSRSRKKAEPAEQANSPSEENVI